MKKEYRIIFNLKEYPFTKIERYSNAFKALLRFRELDWDGKLESATIEEEYEDGRVGKEVYLKSTNEPKEKKNEKKHY